MKKLFLMITGTLLAFIAWAGPATPATGTVGKPVTSKPYKVVVTSVTPGEASDNGTPTVIVSLTVSNIGKQPAKVPVVNYKCDGTTQSDVVGGSVATPVFSGSIQPKGTFNTTHRWTNPTGCVNPTVTVTAPVRTKGLPKPITIKIN